MARRGPRRSKHRAAAAAGDGDGDGGEVAPLEGCGEEEEEAPRPRGAASQADGGGGGGGGHAGPLELCAVVKVFTVHATPNFASPWKTSSQWSSVGSAFPIGGRRLLTNAHVIANAHLIHARRSDGHKKFVATVQCMCFECDLATLRVEDDAFWQGLEPLALAEGLPQLQDEVAVVGFPDAPSGGEAVCITQGVVSRIDLHAYSWDSRLLVVQIDAAINPGNSGGPCVDEEGLLMGVAFQKDMDAGHDNIGYIIPSLIVRTFLECCEAGAWGFGAMGFSYGLLDNPSLCQWVGLPSDLTGVLVTSVEATAPAQGLLEPATDIILTVDGEPVGEDGTVALERPSPGGPPSSSAASRAGRCLRIPLDWLFRRKLPRDSVRLSVLRRGARREVDLPLCRVSPLVPSDPLDGERLGTRPEYLLVGGLVFVPLTEPFLTEEYGRDWDGVPARLLHLALHGKVEHAGQQAVLLSEVLACEFTQGYEVHRRRQVLRCDGSSVRSLRHLAALVAGCREPFLRFELAGDHIIAFRRDGIEEATRTVASKNQIAQREHLVEAPPPPPPATAAAGGGGSAAGASAASTPVRSC